MAACSGIGGAGFYRIASIQPQREQSVEIEAGYQESCPDLERFICRLIEPENTVREIDCHVQCRACGSMVRDRFHFPIPEFQMVKLIEQAVRSPCGKGSAILVDASVRSCWAVDPKNFSLDSRHWSRTVNQVVASAAQGLGLEADSISN